MIGSTAKAEQFYSRSGNESTKGSRKGFDLLGVGENAAVVLTNREKLDNEKRSLHAKIEQMTKQLAEIKPIIAAHGGQAKKPAEFHDAVFKREQVKKGIAEALSRIKSINDEMNRCRVLTPERIQFHFVNVCRERMTAAQFKLMLKTAYKLAEDEIAASQMDLLSKEH